MRILSALLVGLFSGFLIYMIFGLIIGPRDVSSPFVMAIFFGGWALTTYVVLNGAATVAKVWSIGGLIGAVEWLLFGLAMLLYGAKTLAEGPPWCWVHFYDLDRSRSAHRNTVRHHLLHGWPQC